MTANRELVLQLDLFVADGKAAAPIILQKLDESPLRPRSIQCVVSEAGRDEDLSFAVAPGWIDRVLSLRERPTLSLGLKYSTTKVGGASLDWGSRAWRDSGNRISFDEFSLTRRLATAEEAYQVEQLFESLIAESVVEFGWIGLLSDIITRRGGGGPPAIQLTSYLPGLAARTFFGGFLVEWLGDRIERLPEGTWRRVGSGVLIKTSGSVTEANPGAAKQLEGILGDIFFQAAKGKTQSYERPDWESYLARARLRS
jgi:hypothetical protein